MKRWIEDALWSIRNCISFRFIDYNDHIDRLAFFEELNIGWYQMYIYPYDDAYMPIISEQRKIRLNQQPVTFYVTEEDYNAIMARLDEPAQPSQTLIELFNRRLPWDNLQTKNTD
jgi:Protein of unknown function (DUF1778)